MKYLIILIIFLQSCKYQVVEPNVCQQLLDQRKEQISLMSYNYASEIPYWQKEISKTDSLILKYCKQK